MIKVVSIWQLPAGMSEAEFESWYVDQHIELMTRHEDVVLVMGHDVVKDVPDGPVITRRFTNVWCASNGSWKLIGRQATRIDAS